MTKSGLSRLLRRSTLAAAWLGIIAPAGFAYHLFYLQNGASYIPTKWTTTANFTVGSSTGATDITAEVAGAAAAWKNITTAQSPLGTFTAVAAGVKYNGAGFGTVWGVLTGDGKQEVIFDEDGSAFAALGLDPASVNGYGPSHAKIVGAAAVIDDAFLLLNGTRTDFDRQSTETHELGHIQGLAHSAIGMYNSASTNGEFGAMAPNDVFDPIGVTSVPTMHPFSQNTGTSRRTPKADDIAALSELYPAATFTTTLGSISGTVTRCTPAGGAAGPVTGASVRIVNTSNTAIQLGRFSGFDGNTTGAYTINGIPPGSYDVVVEGLGANGFTLDRFTTNVPVKAENDFASEYYNTTCGADYIGSNPTESASLSGATPVTASAGGSVPGTNLQVGGVDLAFVIDNTGSMSSEIAAVRIALAQFITDIQASSAETGKPFPTVAVVPFVDVPSVQVISNNPATLQAVVAEQFASGGGDCPEPSNSALLTAGRLLRKQGVAILFTDADSDYDGPSMATVDAYYRSKELRLSVLLSGSCSGGDYARPGPSPMIRGGSRNTEYTPDAPLGSVDSITSFADESLTSGGIFDFNTEVFSDPTSYTDAATNIADSSAIPAIGLVNPWEGPQGATMTVAITGQNTNFTAGSTVAFSGTGITVNSVAVLSPTSLNVNITIDSKAAMTFRDVTVTSNLGGSTTQTAKGGGAFDVEAAEFGPTITADTPVSGAQGQTLDVQLWGVGTHFASGKSEVFFGENTDISVNSVTVASPTLLTANITIAPDAVIGFRNVSVDTTEEEASDTGNGSFFVTPPAPLIAVISSVLPNSGQQGQSGLSLTIAGQNTHFGPTSLLTFSNAGITITGLTINSATSATATITIDPAAALGFSDVLMTTGGEGAALLSGFQIVPSSGGSITPPPVVTLIPQSVYLAPIPDHLETDPPFQVTASATSGLPVTLSVWGPATINGNTITLTGLGTVTVEADQGGAGVYYPGSAIQSFKVTPGTPAITAVENAASMKPGALAPDSYAVLLGNNLASGILTGNAQKLNGATLTVTDSKGQVSAATLSMVSYKQINFVVPAGLAAGAATVTVTNTAGKTATFPVTIAPVAPGIFTMNSTGTGMALAQMFMVDNQGNVTEVDPYTCVQMFACTPAPVSMAGATQAWLTLYGTGIRGRSSLAGVVITIGSQTATAVYAGPQGTMDGLDQVNVSVPMSMSGAGMVNLTMTVDGVAANVVTLDFK